ncbi:MAG: CocE/NonD family hydrolase, partial [Phenylobacterium sp.]|uniref:CocE/NonD family hydrolase n=1 Tax=Phenylobacterium sp. TaxID=1871053 RepID=UPI001A5DF4CA
MNLTLPLAAALAAALLAVAPASTSAQTQAQTTPPLAPDIATDFKWPTDRYDYVKRTAMIPMRDGVKLYTVLIIPKGAKGAPILLTRTPYNARKSAERNLSQYAAATGSQMDEPFLEDGYIRVYQDVRGKYESEGDYVLTRPLIGPLNDSKVDHSTDAWDTIDWLVKNTPESNGRVGVIGSSYPGFTAAMALINPHPALKAAVPQSPMIDGWMGDDWFHYGAFRMRNVDWFTSQMIKKGAGENIPRETADDYENFLRAGSFDDFARAAGLEQIAAYRKIREHPAYDAFWQEQALDRILAKQPLKVPTLWMGALWDQEDMWGAIHAYLATEPRDAGNDMNFLALGPWRHSGTNYEQRQLGPNIKLPGDTATEFRLTVLKPFLDSHLKTGAPKASTPPVTIFETGTMRWTQYAKWPRACADCDVKMKPIYLTPGMRLSFTKGGELYGDRIAGMVSTYAEYVSDPAKPVPYVRRPVRWDDAEQWRYWLLSDQRHVDGRPDVLTFVTEPLKAPLKIAGEPVVNLYASTSGTDSDWVVKLIDVYPDAVPSDPQMGGYQLGVGMDIFRGRYRESFEKPTAIPANKVQKYRFDLPPANHVFL